MNDHLDRPPEGESSSPERPNSVEISQNAKGGISFTIKSYGETLEQAIEAAKKGHANLDGWAKAVRASRP